MGVRQRLKNLVRRIIGVDPAEIAILLDGVSSIRSEIAEVRRKVALVDEVDVIVRNINHRVASSSELIENINHNLALLRSEFADDREVLFAINHLCSQLNEIGPRVIGLDELRHKLTYAEAIASDHARAASLDAESVAILLRTLERRLSLGST